MEPVKMIDLDKISRAIDIYAGCGPRKCEECYTRFNSVGCPQTSAIETLTEVRKIIDAYLDKLDEQTSVSQEDFIKLLQGELP